MDPSDLQKAHRHFAAETFNACWQFIELPKRTPEEDRSMIRLAESSYWHWLQVTDRTAENESIGLWQLARVYALTGEGATALEYACLCLAIARDNDLGAFHIGYALEGTARAYQVQKMEKECEATLEEAWALVSKIADFGSRELLEADLQGIAPAK